MLLNDGQPTHPSLSVLPCMQEKKLMPIELTNILNARRGKIEFYAKMNLSLGLGNKIHRHSMEDKAGGHLHYKADQHQEAHRGQ